MLMTVARRLPLKPVSRELLVLPHCQPGSWPGPWFVTRAERVHHAMRGLVVILLAKRSIVAY
jgi:hypothetical protein